MELLMTLRHALRWVLRAPGFSALAISMLALGIGAATLMFSLVNAVLIRDLPFTQPDRLVWMYNLRTERDRAPLSIADYEDYRQQASTLTGLSPFINWTANLTGVGSPERLEGTRVAGNFFELLGARPLLGRTLRPDDETTQAQVAVLSYGLWVRRFGGTPDIVGRGVSLNGATYTVVGVLPPRFLFPFRSAEIAVPLTLRDDPRRQDRGANFLRLVARLGPGVSLSQAKADLDAIALRLRERYPTDNARKIGISLFPLHAEIVRDYRAILWALFAAVGVLLAIGCGNLANLLLVRAAGRQGEFAIRLSLGASRPRLVSQLLTEASVLAIGGGLLGATLAWAGMIAWRAWGPEDFPHQTAIVLDGSAVLFALAMACLTALACGLMPAWFASRHASHGQGERLTAGRTHAAVRRMFVAMQLALATVLLIGMGVVARGFARLEQVSPGFTPDRALSLQLSLPPQSYGNRDALVQFNDALGDRLRAMPDVESAGLVSLLPLSGLLSTIDIAFPDRPAPPPDEVPQAHFRVASPEYFSAAGIPILEGRAFSDLDRETSLPVAIVSRTFAERHWPGKHAVGESVQIVQATALTPMHVIGVVGDVKHFTLDAQPTADLYVPLHQMPVSQAPLLAARTYWIVRARAGVARIAPAVRAAVAQVDPNVATSSERTLQAVWSASLGPRRLNVSLLEAFGQVALVLCALGVYGVASFSARSRKRELAIRTALGASRIDVTSLMLRRELWPAAAGVSAGLLAAWSAAPLLFGTPFETDPRDGLTYAGVAAMLLLLAALASYIPVRRVSSARPSEALRL
ncbi:MAG TPA: ABC transporter permease [Vicinamibacterales bacterium]|nr:ABC transporter permease [Vicinamibacterales bacterium]